MQPQHGIDVNIGIDINIGLELSETYTLILASGRLESVRMVSATTAVNQKPSLIF